MMLLFVYALFCFQQASSPFNCLEQKKLKLFDSMASFSNYNEVIKQLSAILKS